MYLPGVTSPSPVEFRARSLSYLLAGAIGIAAAAWAISYLSSRRGPLDVRLTIGVFVIGGASIWMFVEWWRLHRIRLRFEDSRLVFTQGAAIVTAAWTEVRHVELQHVGTKLVGAVVTVPTTQLRLPRELETFSTIVAQLQARATSATFSNAHLANLMQR